MKKIKTILVVMILVFLTSLYKEYVSNQYISPNNNIIKITNSEIKDSIEEVTSKISDERKGFTGSVVKVTDGDTISVLVNNEKRSIRFIGIDTPEKSKTRTGYMECYGIEATEFLKEKLLNKEVFIEFDETQGEKDKYGRYLGHVFQDDIYIQEEILKNGFGFYYLYNKESKYDNLLLNAEKNAKNNVIGVYKHCDGKRKPVQ